MRLTDVGGADRSRETWEFGVCWVASGSSLVLLGVVGMTLATAMSSQWIGRGMLGRLSLLTIGLGVLSVTANLVLVPRFGTLGAAWGSVGTYTLAATAQGWLMLKCKSECRDAREPLPERS